MQRFVPKMWVCGLAVFAMACGGRETATDASATRLPTGAELWSPRSTLPPETDIEFLPPTAEGEVPGFVETGDVVTHAGKTWRGLQFLRDRALTATVPRGKWLIGPLGDEWPAGTVNVAQELHAARLESIEIDGVSVNISPSELLDLSSAEGSFALYVVMPRFTTPGRHTLVYSWRQVRNFYFTYPYAVVGAPDPYPEHEGRRVFLAGEVLGDDPDGVLTVRYTIDVL